MSTTHKLLIVLSLLVCMCRTSDRFPLINDQRTQNVQSYCELSREEMIKKYDEQNLTFMKEQTANSFNIDGMEFFLKIIQGESVEDDLRQNVGNIVVYVGFFAIPFVIILLIWPFLICCCVCPDQCPVCACCRQNQDQPYTNCEQKYPAIVMIVLSIIIITVLVISLAYKGPVDKAYNDTFCSLSIAIDDLLNGNVSYNDSSRYWIGTVSVANALRNMNGSLGDISDSMDSIGTKSVAVQDLNTEFDEIQAQLDEIPGSIPYEYNSPIDATFPYDFITSKFPDVLGDSSTPDTLIFNTSNTVYVTQIAINGISLLADTVKAALVSFSNVFYKLINGLNGVNTEIKKVDDILSPASLQIDDGFNAVVIVFYITVILGIVLAFLIFVSVICVLCLDKYSCRYLAYIACSFLLFFALLYFALAVFFSVATPVTYYSCLYVETGFSEPDSFVRYFSPIFEKKNAEIFSACALSENGDVISGLIGEETTAYLEGINDLATQLSTFEPTNSESQMSASAKVLVDTINNYKRANILDINDGTAINTLNQIADPTSDTCSASQANFAADSWIPSTNQNPVDISCSIRNGQNASVSQCPFGILTSFGGCNGCMDTYSLLEQYNQKTSIFNDLNTRYQNNANCFFFTTSLSNIWQNYYRPKKQIIGAAYDRGVEVKTRIDDLNLQTIGESFNNAFRVLGSNLGVVAHPQIGLIAGLNCKVISEDITLAIQTICDSTFAYVFFQRIMFAIAGWAIMILACFTVCFGVRSFRMSQVPTDHLYLDKDT